MDHWKGLKPPTMQYWTDVPSSSYRIYSTLTWRGKSLESYTGIITEALSQLRHQYMLSYREKQGAEFGLLLLGEVEGGKKGLSVCIWVNTPDQDYVPVGSCHTCLPHHPDLSLSGRHCTHTGSCPSRSKCLRNERKHICYYLTSAQIISMPAKFSILTISIDVYSAGVSLSIVVSVCLVWVTVVRAVVTAVTHIIAVIVILPGVIHEWTVVLFQKQENNHELRMVAQVQCNSFAARFWRDHFTGRGWCEMKECFIYRICPKSNVGISKHSAAPSGLCLTLGICGFGSG